MAKSSVVRYLLFFLMLLSGNVLALTPEAEQGKALYAVCHSCHNPELDPPLGPPMWGVQRRYQRQFADKSVFIDRVVNFVKKPSLETAIHDEAIRQMGLMPAMPLADDALTKIAHYLYEEQFQPPCAHWKIAVDRAMQRNDFGHAQKDQRMLQRFCR